LYNYCHVGAMNYVVGSIVFCTEHQELSTVAARSLSKTI